MLLTHEGKIAIGMAPMLYAEATAFLPKSLFLEDFLYGKSDDPIVPSLAILVHRAPEEGWGIVTPPADPIEEKVRRTGSPAPGRHFGGTGDCGAGPWRNFGAHWKKGRRNIHDSFGSKSGKPNPAASTWPRNRGMDRL